MGQCHTQTSSQPDSEKTGHIKIRVSTDVQTCNIEYYVIVETKTAVTQEKKYEPST